MNTELMDQVLRRLRLGLPVTDNPELREKARRAVEYQRAHPVTDLNAWAQKVGKEVGRRRYPS